MTQKKTVSLALGSGGARGLAHIGVIRWLEDHDYQVTAIAGSSIGSLVGGIYAAGKLDTYEKWVRALSKSDVIRLLDFSYSLAGLFSGDRIMQKLKDMLGDAMIEDLPISYTAVATDLDNSREVWINKGSLFEAIRASIAIPSVFTPVTYHGRTIVDGGVLNPVPIAPTLREISDLTIAVSLSGREIPFDEMYPKKEKVSKEESSYTEAITKFIEDLQKNHTEYQKGIESFVKSIKDRFGIKERQEEEEQIDVVDVMTRSLDSMQHTIARFKLAAYNPNYLLELPANACSMFDFHRANELIDLGYREMDRMMKRAAH